MLISNQFSHGNMLLDVLLISLLIFSLNVKSSIMFFSLNAFFITLLLFFSKQRYIIIDSQKDAIKDFDDY